MAHASLGSSSNEPEPLSLDAVQQAAYDAARQCLQQQQPVVSASQAATITTTTTTSSSSTAPSLVAIARIDETLQVGGIAAADSSSSSVAPPPPPLPTMLTPLRGHLELMRHVEDLEQLETREQALLHHAYEPRQLLDTITSPQRCFHSLADFFQFIQQSSILPRRVCQHPFKKNDIVWVCRTCQADETCVLCHDCFSQSNHEHHDVAFYHAQAGGCCDCGDPDAWDPAGFCPHHGPTTNNTNNEDASATNTAADDDIDTTTTNATSTNSSSDSSSNSRIPPEWMHRVRGVVPAVVDWMVEAVVVPAERAHRRTVATAVALDESCSSDAEEDPKWLRRWHSEGDATIHTSTTTTTNANANTTTRRSQSFPHPMEHEFNNDNDNNDDDDDESVEPATMVLGPLVFSPDAASAHRVARQQRQQQRISQQQQQQPVLPPDDSSLFTSLDDSRSYQLGRLGMQQQGLFLVLFADDIHSTSELVDALRDFLGGSTNVYTDSLLSSVIKRLRQFGYLVIWGPREFIAKCGETQVQLWMDGDKVASARIGAVALERANRLIQRGLFCSIFTHKELMMEQRAVYVLQWLSALARSCDPLCRIVAECILPNRHLVPLLKADFKMSARVTKGWYSLLLTLLAVPTFKSHLAAAYCDTYRYVTSKYARGRGTLDRSGYTLSVQFLNRVTYVVDLVQGRDLLGILGKSILDTLLVAAQSSHDQHAGGVATTTATVNQRLDPQHPVLSHRRYSPCISDLKCVLNVKGMPRIFSCERATFLEDWVAALSAAQFMDPHVWRHWLQGHVENESRAWVSAFNASISLGSLFERLLFWSDEDTSPITNPASPYSSGLRSGVETTYAVLVNGVLPWQRLEIICCYQPLACTSMREPYTRCSNSLPYSTIAAKFGTDLAFRQMSTSQVAPFSFHLPLHRFVASCLRELCLRHDDVSSGAGALARMLRERLSDRDFESLMMGLMEFPTLVLSRAAQIRAGLWKRNGQGLNDQVLNYAEPPFCRTMRDADLLLVQFAVIGQGCQYGQTTLSDVAIARFVHLLLHRLGLFEFLSLAQAPNRDIKRYLGEVAAGKYPKESEVLEVAIDDDDDSDDEDFLPLPFVYSPSRHTATSVILLEEFLHAIIMFSSELPLVAPADRNDHTSQAQWKLHREVIHRLASGAKTHSELSEVQHVLSHWDNTLLNDQGKEINPDDASGAALNMVLSEVAQRKASRSRMEPDKWELNPDIWELYDPAFYHMSLRSHQSAAENRPKPGLDELSSFGWKVKPYAPNPREAHPFFRRLRRDTSTDATVLSVVYKVLHLHCRKNTGKDLTGLQGSAPYENAEPSETALARAVHLLTLGAYAWAGADSLDPNWKEQGGGSPGSVFFDRGDMQSSPTAEDWIVEALLMKPEKLMDCAWYEGEENVLVLLHRLAVDGGSPGGFIAQDAAVRAGAAWLCNFAVSISKQAVETIGPSKKVPSSIAAAAVNEESEIDRRKRMAREKAMERMKAQAAKFASMMDVDLDDGKVVDHHADEVSSKASASASRAIRSESDGSNHSSISHGMSIPAPWPPGVPEMLESSSIPARLMSTRPRCIICNDEDTPESRSLMNESGEGQRKRSRRKTDNALGFVGYAQASTVLKGGGGSPPELSSPMSSVGGFVGAHIALCGHAVHSDCCESYLTTVSHREDRVVGKREEFRCPLCQRLSNCLVPFIDVGVDWISPQVCLPVSNEALIDSESDAMLIDGNGAPESLGTFLSSTPWWVRSEDLHWDGHSAFVHDVQKELATGRGDEEKETPSKSPRRIRSLKKKDLYAAWNSMMRTPRFVRGKLHLRSHEGSTSRVHDLLPSMTDGEDSSGETVVWRRLMDQVSDISYRADSKRLGDDQLHDLFGEFRHYIVEKYSYNMASRFIGVSPVDWPSCLFRDTHISDSQRQEMSREKLLAKLILSIQSFTYSACCESYEAKRSHRKCFEEGHLSVRVSSNLGAVLSKFGFTEIICDGSFIVMPRPKPSEEDGLQPFSGRLGKLRYFGLAVMAAAGAVASDLVQLVLSFPTENKSDVTVDRLRCPIVYPLLFGHVLTHVTAAICAACGRSRAHSDELDIAWPVSFASRGNATCKSESLVEDCIGFVKVGLLARLLQSLLGRMQFPSVGVECARSMIVQLKSLEQSLKDQVSSTEFVWISACTNLLCYAMSNHAGASGKLDGDTTVGHASITADNLREACTFALSSACTFLSDMGMIVQLLVPAIVLSSEANPSTMKVDEMGGSTFDKLCQVFRIESLQSMVESPLVQQLVASWYDTACTHARASVADDKTATITDQRGSLRRRLFRTQGYRHLDWPSTGVVDYLGGKSSLQKTPGKSSQVESASPMQIDTYPSESQIATLEVVRKQPVPTLATFSSKKTAPLLGGGSPISSPWKQDSRPRVSSIPTSYTDLYAELASLLPDCEQTAVCLICGEVLNANGKGECTHHSYKCGAGAGLFFLLQECSGLVMHKSKAAYIHSPYVDNHGETPQYRGRPLNLDLVRYEHLREAWMGHGIRQMVVDERGSGHHRQVILNDFY